MSLRDVFQYELGSLPLSIANYDGSLRKTQKSKLFKHVHPDIPLCDAASENSPKVFVGMVLLPKLPSNQTTFGEVSDYAIAKIVNGTSRVSFFTTDYYLNQSVMAMERERRSTYDTIRIKVMGKEQVTPKRWEKFMRRADNKTDLTNFLLIDWSTNKRHIHVLEEKGI